MQKSLQAIVVIVMLGAVTDLSAQSKSYLGVKGGYNASTAYFFHSFNGSDINTSFEGGFQTGLVFMNFLRNHVGLQAELNYSQKGWKQKFDNGQPDFITELDYLELPLLANIHTGKKSNHIYASLGCFFEYLISVKQSDLPTDTTGEEFFPFVESRDKKFGYGFRGGVGVFHDFNFGTLMLESNFSYSLSDMLEIGSLDSGIPNTSKNMVVGVSIAYLFSFGEFEAK